MNQLCHQNRHYCCTPTSDWVAVRPFAKNSTVSTIVVSRRSQRFTPVVGRLSANQTYVRREGQNIATSQLSAECAAKQGGVPSHASSGGANDVADAVR